MLSRVDSFARRLDSDHPHGFIVNKLVEEAHSVGAAAHAGDEHVRQATPLVHTLPPGLDADDGVEVAHLQRKQYQPRRQQEGLTLLVAEPRFSRQLPTIMG